MAKVNFNLRDTKAKQSTLIVLMLNYDNERMRIGTGLKIDPKYWNAKKQRAYERVEFQEHIELNSQLEDISRAVLKIYESCKVDDSVPTKEHFKVEILKAIDDPSKLLRTKSFWDYFNDFVEYKSKTIKDVRDYNNALRKHLMATEKITGRKVTFTKLKDSHNCFIEKMNDYLSFDAKNAEGQLGLSVNTIGKQFKNLKVFLNWCFDKEIVERFSLKHIVTYTEEVENVYLKQKEVDAIFNLELFDEWETSVRDMFIIGCETALRYSDLISLKQSNIDEGEIHIRPKKTEGKVNDNKVIIPMSVKVQTILERNQGSFPNDKMDKIVEFNKTLREVCKKAKITETISITKKIALKRVVRQFKKYELVRSHTGRRTFCTLKFLAKMPISGIMAFSGHKTEASFRKYLKMDAQANAQQYADYF
jgi:integrase